MEEGLIIPEGTSSQDQECDLEVDNQEDPITQPEVPRKLNFSGRGRKPKKKRGRPPGKNKVTPLPKEQFLFDDKDQADGIKAHSTTEPLSIKLEKLDGDIMVGKIEKKKLLAAMSQQFNSSNMTEPATVRPATASKKGKKGNRGKHLRKETPPTEQFLQPASFEEASGSQTVKKELEESAADSPSLEDDNQEGENELELAESPMARTGRRSRPQSLETALLSRTRNRVGSQSPATGKESPISESSNDSANSRSRGRLRQAIAEEMSSLNESRHLAATSVGKRPKGRPPTIKSDQINDPPKKTPINHDLGVAKKTTDSVVESGGSIPLPQSILLRTIKKKKKHFKGLRYSFGMKKKRPTKPKLNQSQSVFDSSQDNESLISEELDGDSFDSSSVETSSAPMSAGVDPYDPTEEFDDSHIETKEVSFQQQRINTKTSGGQQPALEDDRLEGEDDHSWSAFAEDDEAYADDVAEDQEEPEISAAGTETGDDFPETVNEDEEEEEENEGQFEDEDETLQEDDVQFDDDDEEEEVEVQYEEDLDVNPEYGQLLGEDYEEEDPPADYDPEDTERAIANGIEYMDDTHEGIDVALEYETESVLVESERGAEDSEDSDGQLQEYADEEHQFEEVQLGYADEEPMVEQPVDLEDEVIAGEEQPEETNEEERETAEEKLSQSTSDEERQKIGGKPESVAEDNIADIEVPPDGDLCAEDREDKHDNNGGQEEEEEEEDNSIPADKLDLDDEKDNSVKADKLDLEDEEDNSVKADKLDLEDSITRDMPSDNSDQLSMEPQPKRMTLVIKATTKIKKVKGKKYKKWPSTAQPEGERKRRHSDESSDFVFKRQRLDDEEIASYVGMETNDSEKVSVALQLPKEEAMDVDEDADCGKESDDQIAPFEDRESEKLSPRGEEPALNILVEEDSTDTSEASMNFKGEKMEGSSRRISKRRNGDSTPGVDDKGDARKSKRLNTLSSSGVLTIAARSDGKGYPKLVEDVDQDLANPSLSYTLCKCRVSMNPKAVDMAAEIYCQGFDCFDGRMIGCCNIVANSTYLRVSPKIPFMLLCVIHRQRLRRHNCCPGCGLFCTQGVFSECRWDPDGNRHYYHSLCGLLINGVSLCPHCGTDKPPVEVHLELKLSRKPIIYLKQHQEKKGLLSSARMTCPTLKSTALKSTEEKEPVPEGNYLELPTGKYISAVRLPTGINKERLEEAIKSIQSGKVFNIKASPKAIYWACKYDDLEKLLWVLVSGLSPNAKVREYGNQTGLHTAAMYGSMASTHVLVLAGACFDLTDTQLLTPLMVAITKSQNDVVSYLIQAGANLHARTDDGMTCLHLAAKAGNYDSCKHILDSGRLSRHTINVQDEGGWTPLVWASENRCINVVKLLLDRGADPQICDVEQNTALHWAAFSGSTHICSMVLERGCSLKSMNGIGDTPLHIAARQNHVEVVVQLLARGSRLDVMNKRSQTPLECCLPESQSFLHITLNKKLLDVMRDNGIRTERILCSDIACGKESVPITCVNGVDDEDLPKNYVYISENCEALNVNIDRTISSLKWCECRDGCNTENCVCSQLNFQCWYDPEGKLLVDFNYLDPPMIFECNRACGCNKLSCHNRVVQHGITAHMQLFKTAGKGWGVRALKDIVKGSYVCEYVGEIITDLEADQREDDSYLFDLDNRDTETYCIDARQYANIARFINHLCEPNLTPVKVFIDHQDLVFPRIAFFANRDIEADEELGFDYGEKFWVIKYKQFTCTCNSEKCKYSSGTIQATLEAYNRKNLTTPQDIPDDVLVT